MKGFSVAPLSISLRATCLIDHECAYLHVCQCESVHICTHARLRVCRCDVLHMEIKTLDLGDGFRN